MSLGDDLVSVDARIARLVADLLALDEREVDIALRVGLDVLDLLDAGLVEPGETGV